MEPMTMISAGVGAASGALGIAQGLGLGRRAAERNQLEQQRKLSEQQARIQNESQIKMWRDTNYEAQMGELKKAGLNPALLYGKGGGGGTTVGAGIGGGQAANAAATQSANTQSAGMGIQGAMMLSQLELMKSQANKANAEADAIRGYKAQESSASAAESTSRKASIDFQNELNKTIGIWEMVDRYTWASDKIFAESAKANAEYNAWIAGGFGNMPTDDPNSPIAKAIRAGFEKSVQDLEKAKLENNAQSATNIVKEFEANLAEQGIHPHSPWWTKLITDMLNKTGITNKIKEGLKGAKEILK